MTNETIHQLTRRWRRRTTLARTLGALAAGVPLAVLLAMFVPPTLVVVAGLAVPVLAAVLLGRPAADAELARHLDRVLPELDDSAELLLGRAPRNLLEELQRQRAQGVLENALAERRLLPWRGVVRAGRWLALSTTASVLFLILASRPAADVGAADVPALPAPPDVDVQFLHAVDVRVEPPAYTGKPARQVHGLDLDAAEGARLTWTVTTAENDVDAVVLSLDGEDVHLRKSDSRWTADRVAEAPRLYTLRLLNGGEEVWRSPYARLAVTADAPPDVEVTTPEFLAARLVERPAENPGVLAIEAAADDDYGLRDAAIVATLATGTGEMVEFREERWTFDQKNVVDHADGVGWRLRRNVDLAALGMEPGAELYFYVEAVDNRPGEANRSRTPTCVVRIPGGRGTSVALGDGLPVVTLPEFFRSQRQIIIDTERLVAEREKVTVEEFQRRSQNLGIDQHALRLRYGQFVGDEVESPAEGDEEHGPDDGHDHGGGTPEGTVFAPPGGMDTPSSTTAAWMDALPADAIHMHDSSEIATFFTSAVKATLKASLAQMWDAELRLRTFVPDEALPFEYEALRLLKIVQQSSRVYVQRVGFDAPALQPDEKRLTGDLSKIADQRRRFRVDDDESAPELRRALDVVRDLETLTPEELAAVLDAASESLARHAVDGETVDVDTGVLDLLHDWTVQARDGVSPSPSAEEKDRVAAALWRALPPAPARPSARPPAPGGLYARYRDRLENGG